MVIRRVTKEIVGSYGLSLCRLWERESVEYVMRATSASSRQPEPVVSAASDDKVLMEACCLVSQVTRPNTIMYDQRSGLVDGG